MKLTRLFLLSVLTLAACKGEKVQPSDSGAEATITPEQKEAKAALEYKQRQAVFADSVLRSAPSTTELTREFGKEYTVGTVAMRDSLVAWIGKTPKCYADGKDVDPYLAGTVTFFIHMAVTGSDVIRVQTSNWTSQAGNITDKCLTDSARNWKYPMGVAKQGRYLLQVQFK